MLTKSDLQQIGKLVKAILDAELFGIREDIMDMKSRLKLRMNISLKWIK